MSKREGPIAFGNDEASLTPGAVYSGKVPKRGKQSDATPHKSDEPKHRQHRTVRAWGYLPRYQEGGLQQDHSRGEKASRQNYNTGEFMPEGGNSAGRSMRAVDPYFVDNCQGRSGQPDNQSVSRPKGST